MAKHQVRRYSSGSSAASNALEGSEGVEPGPTPPHPTLRVSSQGSSIFLDRDCTPLKLSSVVGRG